MATARTAIVIALAAALGIALVSGGTDADPATPRALPGEPPPFLGTAVTGSGGLTAAVDAYGDVVELRAPGPAGRALVDNPSARQATGTVAEATGLVPRVDGRALWEARSVAQAYVGGTNVVRTVAWLGGSAGGRAVVTTASMGGALGVRVRVLGRGRATVDVNVTGGARCRSRRLGSDGRGIEVVCGEGRAPRESAGALIARSVRDGRGWIARARPLGPGAPTWARAIYRRSLLVLHALTSRRTGAVAAGARDGWAYVWPRDAGTAAMAFAAAGYRPEARKVAGFLERLGAPAASAAATAPSLLAEAARFTESGAPVPGREAQGDAAGWVLAAERAAFPHRKRQPPPVLARPWRDAPDYQEGSPATYLGNALAATWATRHSTTSPGADGPISGRSGTKSARRPALGAFVAPGGLVRVAGERSSGLDSAAAWAVRPFAAPALYPAARRTLLRLSERGTRFGITPGEGWTGGEDPWTAPTAAGAWALAALGERHAALGLLADLRRAATPAGALPERVGAHTGIPTSTTPLAWSHAFTVLALRQLWPSGAAAASGGASGRR